MPEILIAIMIGSLWLAAWAFYRASKLHIHIEAIHPGFNAVMRHLQKDRRRR